MNKIFFIVTHAAMTKTGDIAGPAHAVTSFLQDKKQNCIFIKHPIYGGFATGVEINIIGKKEIKKGNSFWEKTPLRFLAEGLTTMNYILCYGSKDSVYIGVDPLNALWGLIAKRLHKIGKLITYTPDYSQTRFENKLVNNIYHFIDRLTVKNSDYVWSVSKRIKDLRIKMGIPGQQNFLLPNSPFLRQIPKGNFSKDSDLVLVTNVSKGVDIISIFLALVELRKKGRKYILKIIGVGEGTQDIKEKIKQLNLETQVIFKGRMEHIDIFRELQKSRVGIALYTSDADWTYYCDPMKVRDYLACGLPIIMTDIPEISLDIKKYRLGKVLKEINAGTLSENIEMILGNTKTYQEYRKNALKYAQSYDQERILKKLTLNCHLI